MSYQNSVFNKIVAGFILVSLCFSLVGGVLIFPKKARAEVPVRDEALLRETQSSWVRNFGEWARDLEVVGDILNAWDWFEEHVLESEAWDIAANIFAKNLLDHMVWEIVEWIQGGGSPKFVTDWKGFLLDAAAVDIEEFLNELGLGFLCDPFAPELRIALEEPRPFWERARCTIWDVVENIQNFYNDFTQGDWTAWVKITEPQNNFYGAYMLAFEEKERRRALATEAASKEAESSGGWLGAKKCLKWGLCEVDCSSCLAIAEGAEEVEACYKDCGCQCLSWQIQTPGKLVGDTVAKAVVKDIDWLVNKETWQAYVTVIVDALINRLITGGVMALTTDDTTGASGSSYGSPTYTSVSSEPSTIIAQEKSTITDLINEFSNLKEVTQNLLTEHQTNLGVENQILGSLTDTLSDLRYIQEICPSQFPPWAELTITSQTPLPEPSTCAVLPVTCPDPSETATWEIQLESAMTHNKTAQLNTDYQAETCWLSLNFLEEGAQCVLVQVLSTEITTGTMPDRISQRNENIASTQTWISDIEQAITANQDYQVAMSNWQDGLISDSAFLTARDTALAATQTATKSTYTSFITLLTRAKSLALETEIDILDLQSERGQPGLEIEGTLYYELMQTQDREQEVASLCS